MCEDPEAKSEASNDDGSDKRAMSPLRCHTTSRGFNVTGKYVIDARCAGVPWAVADAGARGVSTSPRRTAKQR